MKNHFEFWIVTFLVLASFGMYSCNVNNDKVQYQKTLEFVKSCRETEKYTLNLDKICGKLPVHSEYLN